jgi:hypothetical protein
MELMTDVREFSVKSNGFNGQLQVDLYTFALVVIPLPTFFPFKTYVENIYRAVTCTKLINYHAIEDSVIVMDKGSVISTKTIAYDAETGTPIVTKTANEHNDPIYNVNYPAYWAYSGMGLAYKNIDREFKNISFSDGKILNPEINQNEVFESGDELYITKQSDVPATPPTPQLSGSITYSCSGTGNNGQGLAILNFSFNTPTTTAIRLLFGIIRTKSTPAGFVNSEGCDEFTFPSGITCITTSPYYVDIPAGVTSYTTPYPAGISNTQINTTAIWSCFDNGCCTGLLTTDIYVKIATPSNGYVLNLTLTNSNITLHNINPNTTPPPVNCINSSANVTKLWAYDTTKNSTPLTVTNKSLIFLDSAGNIYKSWCRF